MGEEAEDILVSLHLSPEEASEYDTVKGKLDAHFVARRNVIFERAKFNQWQQETGESADCFITALHCLAEHCRYGTLHDEMDTDDDYEVAFLGSMTADAGDSPWMTEVKMDNHNTVLKIDTRADVTTVPETLYTQGQFSKLERATLVLKGPGRVPLKVKGKFTATLSKRNKTTKEDVYVMEGLSTPLLSRPAAKALQLVARLEDVSLDSKETIKQEFPKLFSGLSKMEGEYNIVLKPAGGKAFLPLKAQAHLPLLPKIKDELHRMEKQGVISKVEEPTEWCAPMMVVPKSAGRGVRICTDLTELNKSVMRERQPLPMVENTLGQLAGAQVFSKLDANAGFWQIPLAKESSLLTTFITPFGRYCYNRLCFGISSAPEHFQKCMQQVLEALEGVLCQMDDEAGVMLNDKCEFSKSRIKFLGQIIEASGISTDPDKVSAVRAMKEPSNISEVEEEDGAKGSGLSEERKKKKKHCMIQMLKRWSLLIHRRTGWALFSSSGETMQSGNQWRTLRELSAAPNSDTPRSRRRSTWAYERFTEFLIGKSFSIETDHKPLVPLLGSSNLDELPPRIQRLYMRLMIFSYTISHVPGKEIATADVLSRAPVDSTTEGLQEEKINLYADSVIASLPATEKRLREIQTHQDNDDILWQLKQYCVEGWPDKFSIGRVFQPHLPFSADTPRSYLIEMPRGTLRRNRFHLSPTSVALQ
ncbi:hypothetical protein AAFF_G00316920 [Aldrovandia affinis]|uniref:Reverse transcriptase domain-containing protein n=1 Tax=Aldrovandia affinis TaxID=143900 RepID=A0AAD7SPD5_9TELE|nr:hypothetical protein AAFF_G00316920 [Aldrovandia affinis]